MVNTPDLTALHPSLAQFHTRTMADKLNIQSQRCMTRYKNGEVLKIYQQSNFDFRTSRLHECEVQETPTQQQAL